MFDKLIYNPTTGEFFWEHNLKPAGFIDSDGYRVIKYEGKKYPAQNIAWCKVHGYYPSNPIDHINRDRSDNRIENLREVSRSANAINTNAKGYCYNKKTRQYTAYIRYNGMQYSLGSYYFEEDAKYARQLAVEAVNNGENIDTHAIKKKVYMRRKTLLSKNNRQKQK